MVIITWFIIRRTTVRVSPTGVDCNLEVLPLLNS